LPYPAKTLEEALLIIAKHYLDSGNQERSEKIKELMSFHLAPYYMDGGMTDEQAITNMKKVLDLIEQSPKLKTELLRKLKANQDDWIKSRSKTNGITDK
jgi:hypothetical protein